MWTSVGVSLVSVMFAFSVFVSIPDEHVPEDGEVTMVAVFN